MVKLSRGEQRLLSWDVSVQRSSPDVDVVPVAYINESALAKSDSWRSEVFAGKRKA
jgi:hypothetical protein